MVSNLETRGTVTTLAPSQTSEFDTTTACTVTYDSKLKAFETRTWKYMKKEKSKMNDRMNESIVTRRPTAFPFKQRIPKNTQLAYENGISATIMN